MEANKCDVELYVLLNCSLLNRKKQTLMNDVERITIVDFFFAFECQIIIWMNDKYYLIKTRSYEIK